MSDQKELVKSATAGMVPMRRSFSLMPATLGEAMELGKLIAESDFAPKDYKGKPGNVVIAIQMGADVGLKPMQALQNIAVINGRPSIWGDAALALVQAADVLERFHETITGEGTARTATCTIRRKGFPDEIVRSFSVADAQKAGLWGKAGPWQTYPERMLQMRARGFAIRDACADCLMGLILAEEAQDIPTVIEATVVSSPSVPASDVVFQRLPEGLRDAIEKGFATLQMAPAQRLVKLNEFLLAEDGTDEEKGENLLRWARDEFAKRKTGQPVASKKPTNGIKPPVIDVKPAETKAADPTPTPKAVVEPSTPPIAASDIPWGGESASQTLGF